MPGTLNKAELAEVIGCSLPTIDKLLRRHADFPVVKRGGNGSQYEFDPAAVTAFLTGIEEARIRAGAERDDLMQQYVLPGTDLPEDRGLTPSAQLTLAKLRILQRDEQKEAGFLIETSRVRATLTQTFATLTSATDAAIRQVCRDNHIPEPTIRAIEARVNEAKRRAVAELAALLEPEAAADAQPSLALN